MLANRLLQFLLLYFLAIGGLLAMKYLLGLSDYVIPGVAAMATAFTEMAAIYLGDLLDSLRVALLGHALSLLLAAGVGILASRSTALGSLIRAAAYTVQTYPIVAVAPIIFILLGDGLASRLLITILVCYFPLLLTTISVLTEPVADIEHFFISTGRNRWSLQVAIRLYENMGKLITVVAGSATLAMVGTIVAEFVAADAGIGFSIRKALYQSDLAHILVALFLVGIWTSIYLGVLETAGALIEKKWRNPAGGG